MTYSVTVSGGNSVSVSMTSLTFPVSVTQLSESEITTKVNEATAAQTAAETAQTAAEGARDTALTYRDTTLTYKDQAEGHATTAAAEAANALSAVTWQDLAGLTFAFSETIVDATVYDTTQDFDGGAWRFNKKASWYQEDRTTGTYLGEVPNFNAAITAGGVNGDCYYHTGLNIFYEIIDAGLGTVTATTRAGSAEFPAVAYITAETARVIIWDAQTGGMWRVFVPWASPTTKGYWRSVRVAKSVDALNGEVVFATYFSTGGGVTRIDFAGDRLGRSCEAVAFGGWASGVANAGSETLDNSLPTLVSSLANDVAITTLPNAPIDPATGLPKPTILVGTDGGWSQINSDGTVYDFVFTSFPQVTGIHFDEERQLVCWNGENNAVSSDRAYHEHPLLTADLAGQSYSAHSGSTYLYLGSSTTYPQPPLNAADLLTRSLPRVLSANTGVSFLGDIYGNRLTTVTSTAMNCFVTSDYSTGWMPGDIKGAWLASTDDTDLVALDTIADRSVNANGLAVNGTVTKTAVATGAELVAYSGFSATNYLEQPYNSDLDFGTGGFCVMGWAKISSTATTPIISKDSGFTAAFYLQTTSDTVRLYLGGTLVINYAYNAPSSWTHLAAYRFGSTVYLAINGEVVATATSSADTDVASATLRVGRDHASTGATALTAALIRIGATAPTPEQIRKIYNDEKWMFQEGAQVTLNGSSDVVTALAHDKVTGLLHVGTSGGMSVFDGLVRVSEDATAVTTSISANNSRIVRQ